MSQTIEETNKRLVLEAFDMLVDKRDYKVAERLSSAAASASAFFLIADGASAK